VCHLLVDDVGSGSVVDVMVPRSGVDSVVKKQGYESVKGLVGGYGFDLSGYRLVSDRVKGKPVYWHPRLMSKAGSGVRRSLYHDKVDYGSDLALYMGWVRDAVEAMVVKAGSDGLLSLFVGCLGVIIATGKVGCGLGSVEVASQDGSVVTVSYVSDTVESRLVKILLYQVAHRKLWRSKGFDLVKFVFRYCVDLDRLVSSRLEKAGWLGVSQHKDYRWYLESLVRSRKFYRCQVV
jgi:hypothetical protein